MKKWAKEITEPLALLFNILFYSGIFLESLKRANIIAIHKKMTKFLFITTGQYP